jgi:hypothetical protein
MDRRSIRDAFRRPAPCFIRVTSTGFLIDGKTCLDLVGRPATYRLLRKLFEDGQLVCDSPDGLTARNGTLCDACRHPRCRPLLRLHLVGTTSNYVLDLPASSAENFFAVEDQALAEGDRIDRWTLHLTVTPNGTWGEVHFERLRP